MKHLKICIPAIAAALLCGCFQVEDVLTLEADGSGTVKMTVQTDVPEELAGMVGMSEFGGGTVYPPTSEAAARQIFPPKDFTLKVDDKVGPGEKHTVTIEAAFKDVNALLASAYGRAHQLALTTNANGQLKLQALSGGATMAQVARFKPEGEMADALPATALADAQKKKGEMRFEFRVTLPNAVSEASAARENKTVTLLVERAKCKDDEEFAGKLSGLVEAACSLQGVKFSPVTPPRLGLVPFNQLVAGKAATGTALPDTNKIAQAAHFIPYSLQVTRSLDLSGEGGSRNSQAQLTGAIVLPLELAPHRWGEPRLEEATDSKGNSLMPKKDADGNFSMRSSERFGQDSSGEEDLDESGNAKQTADKPHLIALSFKAPEWKIKKIGKIKAVLDLQYLGGIEVVKLSNAVPASLVTDMSKGSTRSFDFDSERGAIASTRLTELGLSLKIQMAMAQGGMTTIALETSGEKASVTDVQVFDSSGRPWPTTLVQPFASSGEDRSCQVMVAGQPKPPFSLAVAVGGVGASVAVPILLENIPIGDK
jgi:hypothetical protein